MPLRAKITNSSFSTQAPKMQEHSKPEDIKEAPGDERDDVLFNAHYGVRTIELNRPRKLHALNASMARKIVPRLLEWRKSDMANVIIISSSAQSSAFCAGGDVASLVQQNQKGPEGQKRSHDFFRLEYTLDHLIATYSKPYIAYMDGVTMGGGVGLSVHAPIRIATEKTRVAMPETRIGLFPDVGASFFLPRLDGALGTYLALTSDDVKGVQAYYTGVATHYVDSASLPNLTARLAELQFKDYDDFSTRLEIVDATIAEYDTGLPPRVPNKFSGALRQAIDRCFSKPSIELIIDALAQETETRETNDPVHAWAQNTIFLLFERSPTSLRVALRLMQLGKTWSIGEAFQREYALAGKFMGIQDFNVGVTARLIDKTKERPAWEPSELADVTDADIDAIFEPEAGSQRLQLIKTGMDDYKEYPYHLGLPSESELAASVRQGNKSKNDIVREFSRKYNDKVGVKEKVHDILERLSHADDEGHLVWASEIS